MSADAGGAPTAGGYLDALRQAEFRALFAAYTVSMLGDIVAAVSQSVKLFISPELVIPPGSRIDVLRPGEVPRTFRYKSSGPAAVYPTHQEIPLELAEKYA